MQHVADPKFVPKVYGHPHAPYRANTKQISAFFPSGTWQAADV